MKSVLESPALGATIRVLVVDDSVIMRRMISRVFDGDASIEVVGTACDGLDALAKIQQLKPHVVTLDVEMPQFDGLQTLREITEHHPEIRVIMLSSLTEAGAQTTIESLMHGASDYVTKPGQGIGPGYDRLASELLFKVRQFFGRAQVAAPIRPVAPVLAPSSAPFELCAFGVSTGGPSALLDVLPMFSAGFPLPIVIVQHMPAVFTQLLAARLNGACAIEVAEGTDGMALRPGLAILAPGGFHMRVVRSGRGFVVKLDEGPKENSCRPAVDVLFRSIADNFPGRSIAVILTGMGQDGLIGSRVLKERGATIFAQDQASSVVWGMPGAIVAANLADRVLPLTRIVPEIMQKAGAR